MAFAVIEDRYAEMELIVFPKVYRKYARYLAGDIAVCAVGTVSQRDDDGPKLMCDILYPLIPDMDYKPAAKENKENGSRRKLYIRVPSLDEKKYPDIRRVRALISVYEGDGADSKVYFYSAEDGGYYLNREDVMITPGLISALRSLCGNDNIR